MTKRMINSVKIVIARSKAANANLGLYMPSDAQTEALKSLYAETSGRIGKRDAARFAQYLMDIDNANINKVYCVCATDKQIEAVEKALATLA